MHQTTVEKSNAFIYILVKPKIYLYLFHCKAKDKPGKKKAKIITSILMIMMPRGSQVCACVWIGEEEEGESVVKEEDRKKGTFWMFMNRDLGITKGQPNGKNKKCLYQTLDSNSIPNHLLSKMGSLLARD